MPEYKSKLQAILADLIHAAEISGAPAAMELPNGLQIQIRTNGGYRLLALARPDTEAGPGINELKTVIEHWPEGSPEWPVPFLVDLGKRQIRAVLTRDGVSADWLAS